VLGFIRHTWLFKLDFDNFRQLSGTKCIFCYQHLLTSIYKLFKALISEEGQEDFWKKSRDFWKNVSITLYMAVQQKQV